MSIGFSARIAIECNLNDAIENNEDASSNYVVLSAKDVLTQIDDSNILLLDVRTPREYVCHRIPNSVLVPVQELADRLAHLDPMRPTICVCEHGIRSETAAAYLAANGFADVATMRGGIVQWPGNLLRGPFDEDHPPCDQK